jgi:predicted ArsR family transcriptional regulator
MSDRDDQEARHQLLRALSHPVRQAILTKLSSTEELSPQECSKRIGVPTSTVSYHFRELAKYDAIALVRTEPVRGSLKHFYRFTIEDSWALEALGLPLPPDSP